MRLGRAKELPVLSGSRSLFLVALKGWLFPKKAPVSLSVCSHRHWFGFQSPLFYLSADSSLLTSLESQIVFISLCLEPFPRGSGCFITQFELWFAVITPFSSLRCSERQFKTCGFAPESWFPPFIRALKINSIIYILQVPAEVKVLLLSGFVILIFNYMGK